MKQAEADLKIIDDVAEEMLTELNKIPISYLNMRLFYASDKPETRLIDFHINGQSYDQSDLLTKFEHRYGEYVTWESLKVVLNK